MNIYEYLGTIPELDRNLFSIFPDPNWGKVVCFALPLLFLLWFFIDRKSERLPSLRVALPTFIYVGAFISLYGITDEVFVNLEHAYNLMHHGRFSMSPSQMRDGTVELIYYLFHVPFASNHQLLVIGNFFISLFIGWLHLFYLSKRWFREVGAQNLMMLCLFALVSPGLLSFSSGFGTSLFTLLFLIAVSELAKGNRKGFVITNSILPVVRPEGILVAGVLSVVFLVCSDGKNSRRSQAMVLALPLAAFSLYLLTYRICYGHFIPTPALFKRVSLSMMQTLTHWDKAWVDVLEALRPLILSVGLMASFYWFFRSRRNNDETRGAEMKVLSMCCAFFFLPFVYMVLASHTIRMYMDESRYWSFYSLLLALVSLLTVVKVKKITPALSILFFLLIFITTMPQMLNSGKRRWKNRSYPVAAGFFAERLFPGGFRLSTTEMNGFGYATDHEVLDLFGYTEREIAKSDICHGSRNRTKPELFLRSRPDVYWPYWFRSSAKTGFDHVEKALLFQHLLPTRWNALGDMNEVAKQYDLYLFRDQGDDQIAFLIHRDQKEVLRERLAKMDFQLNRQRRLEDAYFAEYSQMKVVQYPCS